MLRVAGPVFGLAGFVRPVASLGIPGKEAVSLGQERLNFIIGKVDEWVLSAGVQLLRHQAGDDAQVSARVFFA